MRRSNELRKRLTTGIIGGTALLSVIIFGGWIGIFFITIVISLGMVFEFSEMTLTLKDRMEKRYLLLCMTWVAALLNFLFAQLEYALLITSFLSLFAYFLWTAKRHTEADLMTHFQELMYSIFGLTYLVFIPLFFARIYGLTHGVKWTILFLLIVWAGDSGAYFAGKKYGRTKLYPRMSPKKTWEGALGGFLSGFAATVLFKLIFFSAMNWESVLIIPCVVSPMAQIGDLCESFFKRAFDKKDSGSILPGHGGFLDRFDGVVFSLPVMYAFIRILG